MVVIATFFLEEVVIASRRNLSPASQQRRAAFRPRLVGYVRPAAVWAVYDTSRRLISDAHWTTMSWPTGYVGWPPTSRPDCEIGGHVPRGPASIFARDVAARGRGRSGEGGARLRGWLRPERRPRALAPPAGGSARPSLGAARCSSPSWWAPCPPPRTSCPPPSTSYRCNPFQSPQHLDQP
jgi:hypothetical protein